MARDGIVEGSDLAGDLKLEADVCVVGSGAGGAVAASDLAELGRSVVLLEEGGYYVGSDFNQREDDMFARIDGGRGFETSLDGSINLTYAKCVGGSTVHYWADSFRIPEDRLSLWTRTYGVEGRGISELAPHYDRLEKIINVHPAPDALFNGNNWLLKRGAEALGWHGERVTQARRGCVGSGYCMLGCTYGAKGMHVNVIPRGMAHGARVFADARVEEIVVEGGRAAGVKGSVVRRGTGEAVHRFEVRSRSVVLAAGGYATPALLLRNRLANRSGQVGRNLLVNPGPMAFALFDEDVVFWRKIPSAYGVKGFRRVRRDDRGGYVEGGYLLLPNGSLFPGVAAAVLPGFGASHRRLMDQYHRLGATYCILDDEEPGRIVLGEGGRGTVRYTLRGVDVLKARDFLAKSAQVFFAAGARKVLLPDGLGTWIEGPDQIASRVAQADLRPGGMVLAAPHPLGGCRMGPDPATSVVASDGQCHDVRGLWIADSSVFPTSVSVDPSLTIMAFAAVTARKIHEALG